MSDPRVPRFDSSGGMYVSDFNNYRVLYFPAGSTTASRVYGQSGNFTTRLGFGLPPTADSLSPVSDIAVDSAGGVYFADDMNNRVLYYPSGSTTPTRVYGQYGSFTSNSPTLTTATADTLHAPSGLALDNSGGLYISDDLNNRVLYYPAGTTTATRVYGQPDFTSNHWSLPPTASNLRQPARIALDASGDLYVADYFGDRVLMYPPGSTTATKVWGQPDFSSNTTGTSASTLYYPEGLAVDSAGDLYVSDFANNRVVYFPQGSTVATRVWGQGGSFNSGAINFGGVNAGSLYEPTVTLDAQGNLYTGDYDNRVLEFKCQ